MHVSADDELPPEQTQPAVIDVQVLEQPLVPDVEPLSHFSMPTLSPSPQTGYQTEVWPATEPE